MRLIIFFLRHANTTCQTPEWNDAIGSFFLFLSFFSAGADEAVENKDSLLAASPTVKAFQPTKGVAKYAIAGF